MEIDPKLRAQINIYRGKLKKTNNFAAVDEHLGSGAILNIQDGRFNPIKQVSINTEGVVADLPLRS